MKRVEDRRVGHTASFLLSLAVLARREDATRALFPALLYEAATRARPLGQEAN